MAGDGKPQSDKANKPPRRHWYARESFIDLKLSHWVEIALTLALVVIGAVQAIIYFRQAKIMQQQTGIAQTQANIAAGQLNLSAAVERAFIFRRDIWLEYGVDDDRWRFTIEWENSGNTPPYNLQLHPYCRFGALDLIPPFGAEYRQTFNPDPSAPGYVLGPKQSQKIGRCPLNPEEVEDARQKQKFLFIGGQATYQDAFGSPHKTQFCEQYMVPQLSALKEKGSFEARQVLGSPLFCWGPYNCTDADCDAKDAYEDARRNALKARPQAPQ